MTRDSPIPAPRALKRYGQNFLIDPNIVRKIVASAGVRSTDCVLEIGPGRGILTRALCAAAGSVIAIELDPQLVAYLRETHADCRNLDLRHGDALDFPFQSLPHGTIVVANLPYYVSTPLLFTLFDAHERIDRMVLMLQTEVAKRLVAQPGGDDYGILSVLTQYRTEPSLRFRVSRHCFRPQPDVESAVVHLAVRKSPHVRVDDEALFTRIVRAAFAHRRKTLANSLRDEGLLPEQISRALVQANIQPTRRAETLSLVEFAALTRAWCL
ncbi:MAG TPA: 16S rRNA (adenine(1518)-N(6)/adenine(1519)-N(6))-dimethyltransferase RsmA [Nitrospiraceae bacterium]|nr:16S rRNA (adenine(1518)-N(6)/adenine(1519)-N(6))-dimethyltransferase RsmA [Nitrospiraceae bacterium]